MVEHGRVRHDLVDVRSLLGIEHEHREDQLAQVFAVMLRDRRKGPAHDLQYQSWQILELEIRPFSKLQFFPQGRLSASRPCDQAEGCGFHHDNNDNDDESRLAQTDSSVARLENRPLNSFSW